MLESLNQDASLEIQELPEDQALQLVRSGKLRAAIVFPADFEAVGDRRAGRHRRHAGRQAAL